MVNVVNDDIYFSEREQGLPPQDKEHITKSFWDGFAALISQYINNGSFAEVFPVNCEDAPVPVAVDTNALFSLLVAEIPSINPCPLNSNDLPDTLSALDVIQFFYHHVSKPTRRYHPFFRHYDLLFFDKEAGREDYRKDVNRLFRRNNLAFELKANGEIERLGPIILRDILARTIFRSEDQELNELLDDARKNISDPDLAMRRIAVEKLWDAWERLKTLGGPNKKQQINDLLTRAISLAELRDRIEQEAQELTEIGNKFRIRHSETEGIS